VAQEITGIPEAKLQPEELRLFGLEGRRCRGNEFADLGRMIFTPAAALKPSQEKKIRERFSL